jgi:hypothetical protein
LNFHFETTGTTASPLLAALLPEVCACAANAPVVVCACAGTSSHRQHATAAMSLIASSILSLCFKAFEVTTKARRHKENLLM